MRDLFVGIESEVARRLVHASGSLVPLGHVFAPDVVTWPRVQWLLVVGLVLALGLEIARLVFGFEWWIFDHLTRSYEQDNLAGYALAVISVTAVVLIAPPVIAVPSILILTLGDPISGLLGSGQVRPLGGGEALELIVKPPRVLVTMFLVSTTIGAAFVAPLAAILGGLAATVADGAKPIVFTYVIDDNFTIPLAAAGAIALGLALV